MGTALQAGRLRFPFPMVSLEFFIDIILLAAIWPWNWLSLLQKWVTGIFPGGKSGRCVGLTTLPPSCADCLEIWEPQPPGALRACPGLYRDCCTLFNTNRWWQRQLVWNIRTSWTAMKTHRSTQSDSFLYHPSSCAAVFQFMSCLPYFEDGEDNLSTV